MVLVGLTGGIGSGKSSVSSRLAACGAIVVDADAIVHELQEPGTEVFAAIVEAFGEDVVGDDGRLDRPRLAEIVFGDHDRLEQLNGIVHPAVGREIAERLSEAPAEAVVILDVPLLVESGRDDMAGLIVVDVDPEVAVQRLVQHRGMSEPDVRARMQRQASRHERLERADHVIDNSGTLADLDAAVAAARRWIETLR